jgi:hypothetical protein
MPTYTITQLPTLRDTAPCWASTKRKWHGPATILTIEHDDGSRHQIEYDYMPDATLDSLEAISKAARNG